MRIIEELERHLNNGFSGDNPFIKAMARVSDDDGRLRIQFDDEAKESIKNREKYLKNRKANKNRFK